MNKSNEQKIINSWKNNVQPWISAVRKNEIESRFLVTNEAIVNVILDQTPETVLDIGCGEGWLSRELTKLNIITLGVDIVPTFIECAQKEKLGSFKKLSFDDLSTGALKEKYDVIVCNFSLFGKESVKKLLRHVPHMLNSSGSFIVQTIHPISGCGKGQYENGWRDGSWSGFNEQFQDPAPWYFRTLEAWECLFIECGFNLSEKIEPINPKIGMPASVIFVGTIKKS